MKKYILTICLCCYYHLSNAQQCFDTCDASDTYPSDFKGQLCWLLNEVCYNFKLPKWNSAKKASNEDVQLYLKYTTGDNSFYYSLAEVPWASNWFACKYGGISRRWQLPIGSTPVAGRNYPDINNLLSWSAVKRMSKDELNQLSPAEKMDIYLGNKDFKITRWELEHRGPNRGRTTDDNYCGFCNGARSSGALMKEPVSTWEVKAGAGAALVDRFAVPIADPNLEVSFSPADIKALAAASFYYNERAYNIGINNPKQDMADPNPAILDFMLRFLLNKCQMPFFLDVMPNEEIWNETIVGYDRATEVSTQSVAGIAIPNVSKIVNVSLKLYCQDEVDIASINTETRTKMSDKKNAISKRWVKERNFKYQLYIDKTDKILGGHWLTTPGWETRVPSTTDLTPIDFIWMASGGGADDKHNGNPYITYDAVRSLVRGMNGELQAADSLDPNISRKQKNPHSIEVPQPMISTEHLRTVLR